jgi:DNA replication protein DnaC
MIEHDPIGLLLGHFGLTSLSCQLEEVEAAARNGSLSYRRFLRELLEREEEVCSGRRLKRLLKESRLPEAKTAANLELKHFSQATRQAFTQLCEGDFCEAA